MSSQNVMHVFIDESGQRSPSAKSSDYFIMSAVLVMETRLDHAREHLAELKKLTNRKPDHLLHWKKLSPDHRSVVSRQLGSYIDLGYISVVACKRVLANQAQATVDVNGESITFPMFPPLSEDEAYLKTYQYLLERISWAAERANANVDITIEHTIRFKAKTLREFETQIKQDPACSAKWEQLPNGAKLRSKKDEDLLQLADVVASGIGAAFNGHPANGTDSSHIHAMAPRIWKGPYGTPKMTTYGLKMHPWNDATRRLHPWLMNI